MKYLLDTHTVLWWNSDAPRLSNNVINIIRSRKNTLFLSLVSVWELQIKINTGKLTLPISLEAFIIKQQKNRINLLNINLQHIYGLASLPLYHRDPFDRLLVAQAIATNLPLITDDSQIVQYPVQVIW